MKRTLIIHELRPDYISIPDKDILLSIKLSRQGSNAVNEIPAVKFARLIEYQSDNKPVQFEYELGKNNLINVDVFASPNPESKTIHRKTHLATVSEPVLVGRGEINMTLKGDQIQIDIEPTRKPKIPKFTENDLHRIPQWRRPKDYEDLRAAADKNKEQDKENEVDLEKLEKEAQEQKQAELNHNLDLEFVDFNAKLIITIETNSNGNTTRSKLERTEQSIVNHIQTKEQAKAEEEKRKIEEFKQRAVENAQKKYDAFINAEYKWVLDNKNLIKKMKAEDVQSEEEEEEEDFDDDPKQQRREYSEGYYYEEEDINNHKKAEKKLISSEVVLLM